MTTPQGGVPGAGVTPGGGVAPAAGVPSGSGVPRGGQVPRSAAPPNAAAAGAAVGSAAGQFAGRSATATAGGAAGARSAGGSARKGTKQAGPSSTVRKAKPARPPRLASLQLRRIDPWTALKISLIVSIVMFFVWMTAVGVLYLSLESLGVWNSINETYNTLVVSGDSVGVQPDLITPGTIFGVTAIVGAINIVLFTALSTIAAFIYNAAAGMAGGVELTLGERD